MTSYERKKHITSREEKDEQKNREERTVKAMAVTLISPPAAPPSSFRPFSSALHPQYTGILTVDCTNEMDLNKK